MGQKFPEMQIRGFRSGKRKRGNISWGRTGSSYKNLHCLSNKWSLGATKQDLYLRLKNMSITIIKIMKNFITRIATIICSLLLLSLIVSTDANATMRYFTGTGNFGSAANWNGGTMPSSSDTLIINGICTVENNAATDNVAYAGIAIGYGTTGTLKWPVGGTNRIRVVNGLGTVSGGTLDMTNGGHIIVGRQFVAAGLTFLPGIGTVEITSPLTIPSGYGTYYNLIINLTNGTLDLTTNTTVTNDLTVTKGQFNLTGFTFTVNNNTILNDSLVINNTTGTKTFNNLTINSGGMFLNSANDPFTINGNLTNNGTYNGGTGALTFGGAATDTISGSSITNFGTGGIILVKTAAANILDVQSVITMTGTLTLTSGTFKLSSASFITPFPADIAGGSFLIPSVAGLWCNGGTINSPNMNWSVAGTLRVSAGTFRVGSVADNVLIPKSTASIIVDGGTLRLSSRISNPTVAWTFNMSGGTMLIDTAGSTAAAPFNMDVAGCSFAMSGGTMIIQRAGTGSTGFNNLATSGGGFTGGTLQIGNSSTPAASVIRIISTRAIYNLSVNSANVSAQLITSSLVVTNNVTIASGTLDMNTLNLSIGANFTNNGTFTASTGRVTFSGSGVDTVSGSSTTAFNLVTLNKGTSTADVLDVQSVITIPANSFTLTNGTFKVTGASTLNLFNADVTSAPYLIPSTAGIWCNGGTINSAAMNWTVAGLIRVSGGTFTIGSAANNVLIPRSTATVTVDGGMLKLASRISNPGTAWTFNMSGGTMMVDTLSSTTAGVAPFNMDVAACSFSMSGGTMIIVRSGGSAGQNLGFNNLATSGSGFTGGTLQIGTASTPASSTIKVTSTNPVYNLTVNHATVTALLTAALTVSNDVNITLGTLDVNNMNMNVGGNWTKASAAVFTPGTATVTFDGTAAQAINGTTVTHTFNVLVISKSSGTTLSTGGSATAITAVDVTETSGNFNAPATLTISGNLVLTAGTFTAGAAININGNWSTASAATFTHSSGTVTFSAGTAQTIGGTATSQSFYNIVEAKTAGVLLSATGSTATISCNNFTLTTGNFTAPATFTVNGTLNIASGTYTAGANTNVGVDLTLTSGATFTHSSGTVTFTGSGAQSINGTTASRTFYNVVIAKSGGTVSGGASVTTITVNNFTQTTGSFSAPATMNINGNLVLSAGTYTAATNTNIAGNWTKNSGSTFTHNSGIVTMNGGSAQTIGGSSSTTFYKLVNGNASGLVLGASINVTNDIDLSSGSISLDLSSLSLGTATISNSSSTHYFITRNDDTLGGSLIRTVGAVAKLFPVGNSTSYTPVTVTNAGTSDDFRVKVFSGVFKNGTSGGLHPDYLHSVNKTWMVEESVIGGSNVSLSMQWNQTDENASFTRGNCALFHYTGGAWDMPGSFTTCSTVSPGVYNRTRTGITSFSPFAIGDRLVPLPVELISFTARKIEKSVVLNWSTATEINNSHFAIERSTDGTSFTAIDSVAGAGNSNSVIDYNYTDMNAIPATNSYYRLRQVDFDGKTSYSAVQLIKVIQTMTIGDIYPMPAVENINVPVESLKGGNCTADIYDLSGKLVHSETFTLGVASQTLSISTADLKQGMYVLSINNSNGENHTMKLLK